MEYDALQDLPQPEQRIVGTRTIKHRITASYRGREFFDGDRDCGYGGLKEDGRWGPVADRMIERYGLKRKSTVLQLNSEKGFLLAQFRSRGISIIAIDNSFYAQQYSLVPTVSTWSNEIVDLIIGIGIIYTGNLWYAMDCLRKIEEHSSNSFITLAAYDNEEDLRLLRKWTLLGCTILRKDEWIEVMKHCGYTGDYSFVTAKTLKLCEAPGVF